MVEVGSLEVDEVAEVVIGGSVHCGEVLGARPLLRIASVHVARSEGPGRDRSQREREGRSATANFFRWFGRWWGWVLVASRIRLAFRQNSTTTGLASRTGVHRAKWVSSERS